MKKISRSIYTSLIIVCLLVIGVSVVFFNKDLLNSDGLIFVLFYTFTFFLLSAFIHIIIHEFGHLIFGLISGYKFVSFRVGSFAIVKEDGVFKFKRYSIPGTAGQCILSPPINSKTDYPYKIYNFGGLLMNLLLSALGILFFLNTSGGIKLFSYLMFSVGILVFIMNGIPVEGGITDGTNLLELSKNKDERIAFYNLLEINRLYQEGIRPRDIPKECFSLKDYTSKNSNFVSTLMANSYAQVLDEGDYIGAFRLLKSSLKNSNISDLMRLVLEFEYGTVAMLLGDYDIPKKSMEDKQFFKLSKYTKLREIVKFNYIYNLLVLKDYEKAEVHLQKFHKLSVYDPFQGDVKFQYDLIKKAQEINEIEKNIIRLEEIDSTNNYAKILAEKEFRNGLSVISKFQSAGRGQRESKFYSPEGGIYLSVILKPELTIEESKYLSAFAALLVSDSIAEILNKKVSIKWINDLIYNDRKIGGILTETKINDNNTLENIIIGIGLNLYNNKTVPEEIADIFGTLEVDDYKLLENQLAYDIIDRIKTLSVRQNVLEMISRYNEKLYKKNEEVKLLVGNEKQVATLLRINNDLKIEVLIGNTIKSFSSENAKLLIF